MGLSPRCFYLFLPYWVVVGRQLLCGGGGGEINWMGKILYGISLGLSDLESICVRLI